MSKTANPTLIGGFVVGAAVLGVAGVAYFGSGDYLAERFKFVAFFDGSLKGLDIGAPVNLRGVRVGTVSRVMVLYDRDDQSVRLPVYFELEQNRVDAVRERARDPYQSIQALIDDGLRAQLVTQSFVTGKLAVELDFYRNRPVELVGAIPDYFEFPTIPSTVEEIGKAFEDFDLQGLLSNIESAVEGIEQLAQSSKVREAIASLNETIKNFGKLARDINAKVDSIADGIDETADATRRALDQVNRSIASVEGAVTPAIKDVQKLIQRVDGKVNPIVTSFVQTGETAQAAMEQARATLAVARNAIAEDSELYYKVGNTLDELAGAARAIRGLADYLEQHPEALLKGKHAPGGK